MISLAEARKRGWITDEPKHQRARSAATITHWTRSNIEQWDGPDGWRVGIARMWRESGMVDMVVAWRDGKAGVRELVEWETFKQWTVEQVETKLKEQG